MKMQSVKLSELCKMQSGGTPKRGESKYYDGDIPWAKISDLESSGDGFVYHTEETITKAGLKAINGRIFPSGTLLLAMYGSVGKTAIAAIELSTNQAILGIQIKDSKRLDLKYLKHWLFYAKEGIINRARGVALQNISLSIVKDLEIPLPPLAEQIHIAQVLDRADRLRQQDRQLLAHYDQLVQAVFVDMFGDPVRNEKGWDVKTFGSLGEARLGKMLDARKQTGKMLFPYLGNSNVQWGEFRTNSLLEMDFSEKDRKEFSLSVGDLLICEGGEVGRTAIWKKEKSNIYFQKALHRVRLKTGMATPEYIQHLMWFFAHGEGFKDVVNIATIPHLTGEKLRGLKVPVPPFHLQVKFSEIIGAVEAQKTTTQQLQLHSEALFNSLLQQAFRGELGPPKPAGKAAAGQLRLVLE